MSAEAGLQALQHVYDAADRLAGRGLGVGMSPTPGGSQAGVNADGFQTLGDLAAVLMAQTSTGTRAERLLSTTCRALLSAQAAVSAEMADEPTGPHIATAE